jgi:hypothetical protein
MRKERFLIGILWLIVTGFVAMLFFNTVFGFNLLSLSHWNYLAELQVKGLVDKNFYISLSITFVIALIGLYILIHPWHRKININAPMPIRQNEKPIINIVSKIPSPVPVSSQMPSRPPSININAFVRPAKTNENISQELPSPSAESLKIGEIKALLSNAGFILKKPISFSGTKVEFAAIGADEAFIVGLFVDSASSITAAEGENSKWVSGRNSFDSPVWQLSMIIRKIEALFVEVLDSDLKINILPFVFTDGKIVNRMDLESVWDAVGIKVFDDMSIFRDFLDNYRPRTLDDSEKEDFDAYSSFIDTVSTHFNSGGG